VENETNWSDVEAGRNKKLSYSVEIKTHPILVIKIAMIYLVVEMDAR
jgi:hypothetical protein